MKTKLRLFFDRYIPRTARVFGALALVALIVHILSAIFPVVADAHQRYIASLVRGALGLVSGVFPFSLAELLLLLLPLWLFLLIFVAVRISTDRERSYRMLSLLLSVLMLFYALFVFSFGMGYLGKPLEEKLSLDADTPTAGELYDTTLWLTEELDALAPLIEADGDGATEMPYNWQGMNKALLASYGALADEYSFLSRLPVGTKRILLSSPMTYTGITGVYTYFTGEANVNTTYPDYSTVFTAAHEMAHQRGVAREDEANFIAFLVCIGSDDAYLRYAGYLNMLHYVGSALYRADSELFSAAATTYPPLVRRDMHAYNQVYDRYDGAVIGDISEGINDAYLQVMGTEGTVSYGLVAELAVAYYLVKAK